MKKHEATFSNALVKEGGKQQQQQQHQHGDDDLLAIAKSHGNVRDIAAPTHRERRIQVQAQEADDDDGEIQSSSSQAFAVPGANFVGGDGDGDAAEEYHRDRDIETTRGPQYEDATSQGQEPIHAFLVSNDDENDRNETPKPEVVLASASVWEGYWTKKKIFLALLLLAVLAIATGLIVAYTVPPIPEKREDISLEEIDAIIAPSIPPSFLPTEVPSLHPRAWTQIGHLEPWLSEDEFGASVAMSRYGTYMAVGAVGYWEGEGEGRVDVFEYDSSERTWKLVGSMSGNQTADELGRSVSLSEDGTVVAMGAPFSSDRLEILQTWLDPSELSEPHSGYVKVYQRRQEEELDAGYTPMGSIIWPTMTALSLPISSNTSTSTHRHDQFGWMVDLSADGQVLAVSDRSTSCRVWMYRYNGTDWVSLGGENHNVIALCQGSNDSDMSPTTSVSISLSGDGSKIAVAVPNGNGSPYHGSGFVRIFAYGEEGDERWQHLGQDLKNDKLDVYGGDEFGAAVSLSEDGHTIAVGIPGYGDLLPGTEVNNETGLLQVFHWNGETGLWEQRGQDILGQEVFDRFGSGVSLSADGLAVAGGATGSNENGQDSGHVRVFRFDPQTFEWKSVGGGAVAGPIAQGEAGDVLALSVDGTRLCVGTTPPITSDLVGYAQVFELGIFVEAGSFPVYIETEDGYKLEWYVERMDVATQERVYRTDLDCCLETSTALEVPQAGLYKLSIIDFDWYYDDDSVGGGRQNVSFALLHGKNRTGEVLASGFTNFRATTNIFFLAESLTAMDDSNFVVSCYGFDNSIKENSRALNVLSPGMELWDPSSTGPGATGGATFFVVKLEIEFGSRPPSVEWFLKIRDNVLDGNSSGGRTIVSERLVAFGAEYGSENAYQVVTAMIKVGDAALSATANLILSFVEELREDLDHMYSQVRLFNVTQEDEQEVLLLSLNAPAVGRNRRSTWTIPYFI